MSAKAVIKNMDTDGDGLIARIEWKGPADAFDQIDANRDARLSIEELTAHLAASQNSGGGKKSGGKGGAGTKSLYGKKVEGK